MKSIIRIAGITFLIALFVVPIVVWAHGWGMGNHMMGYGSGGYDHHHPYNKEYSTLTSDQKKQLADLDRTFYNETGKLRDQLRSKSVEFNTLLSEKNPKAGKAIAIQKEISDLQAKLNEKAVNYEIEARKIVPDFRFGSGYGFGHMMGGYGMGYGMGYDPGTCWN